MEETSALLPEEDIDDHRHVHFDSICKEEKEDGCAGADDAAAAARTTGEDGQHRWSGLLMLSPGGGGGGGTGGSEHRRRRTLSDALIDSYAEIKEMIVETVDEVKETVTETITEGITEFQEVLHEEVCEPIKPREEGDHSQKLSTLALAVLVFYKVSGGPFGCEPSVKAAGPFVAILGFIITPIIWCIPEALVTAELGSAYPGKKGRKFSGVLGPMFARRERREINSLPNALCHLK